MVSVELSPDQPRLIRAPTLYIHSSPAVCDLYHTLPAAASE